MRIRHNWSDFAESTNVTVKRSSTAVVGTTLLLLVLVAACSADSVGADAVGHGSDRVVSAQRASAANPVMSPGLRAAAISALQEGAGEGYHFSSPSDPVVAAWNAVHGLEIEIDHARLTLAPSVAEPAWWFGLGWTGLGRGTALDRVEPIERRSVVGNRTSQYRRDGSVEWYLNGPLGIEQGFVLSERPGEGAEPLIVELTVSGHLTPVVVGDGEEVSLCDEQGRTVLRYSDLFVKDDTGEMLASRFAVQDGAIRLVVDDQTARYPLVIDPLVWMEMHKLTAGDAANGQQFGLSVAVAGSTAIIGAPNDGGGTGAAYVFRRDEGGLDNWGQQRKVVADDASAGARFGHSVAVSGDSAVVGAPGDGGNRGAIYALRRNEGGTGNWGQVAKLVASDGGAGDQLGASLAQAGDRAIAGAPFEDGAGSNSGAAYVFERETSGGDSWSEITKLTADDAQGGDQFGAAVAAAGNTAIVGAPLQAAGGTARGAAYVFDRDQDGPGSWGQVAKLTASDGQDDDQLGLAAGAADDFAILGAPLANTAGTDSGAAYLFERDLGGTNAWGEVTKLVANDGAADDEFGSSVAVAGDRALVGAPLEDGSGTDSGSAYLFERGQGGPNNWGLVEKLSGSDTEGGDGLGGAVALALDVLVLAAASEDGAGSNRGAAYAFELRLQNGDPCTAARDCFSLFCADGVCCDSECGDSDQGDCMACTQSRGSSADGVCEVLVDGYPCDDGIFCNGEESCADGVCGSSPGDPCVSFVGDLDNDCSESCDETTDSCSAVDPDGTTCTDGQACNGADQCRDGECSVHETECPAGAGGGAAAPEDEDDGCGCRLPAQRSSPLPLALVALLGAGWARSRRRRRRGPI